MNEIDRYIQKAVMYDLLARYYQYRDHDQYEKYMRKHMEYVEKIVKSREEERVDDAGRIRVFHASPNAPAVDVYVNGQKILRNMKYKQLSQYMKVPKGEYRIDVYPAGHTTSPVLSQTIQVLPKMTYTLAVIGDVHRLQLLSILDEPYAPYGKAKVRFAHFSPDAPAVDIALRGGDVLFQNASFGKVTNYIEAPVNEKLHVDVRVAGTNQVVLSIPNVRFQPNKSYTVVAVGYVSRTPSLQVLVLES
ncbi:MAG: DUF4397 domain-containing protein [Anoxybacillus ayderensis]|nr:DUF4397 domain-containing protein [Anoxybacillus ayderensis]